MNFDKLCGRFFLSFSNLDMLHRGRRRADAVTHPLFFIPWFTTAHHSPYRFTGELLHLPTVPLRRLFPSTVSSRFFKYRTCICVLRRDKETAITYKIGALTLSFSKHCGTLLTDVSSAANDLIYNTNCTT